MGYTTIQDATPAPAPAIKVVDVLLALPSHWLMRFRMVLYVMKYVVMDGTSLRAVMMVPL